MTTILLTNDDGIDAPGLAALADALESTANLCVVAPRDPHSGCGHQVTHYRPLTAEQRGPNRWSVDGSPADCVLLALTQLLDDVDWVLSGVNDGANVGVDVYMSGTAAAAREAAWGGKPAIALSQYRAGNRQGWAHLQPWLEKVLADLQPRELPPGCFWNVNFPDPPNFPDDQIPEIVHCPVDTCPLGSSFRLDDGVYHYTSDYHGRPRQPGTDVAECFGGKISVSLVGMTS